MCITEQRERKTHSESNELSLSVQGVVSRDGIGGKIRLSTVIGRLLIKFSRSVKGLFVGFGYEMHILKLYILHKYVYLLFFIFMS